MKTDLRVQYHVNEDATELDISVTATDGKPMTVADIAKAFKAVLAEIKSFEMPGTKEVH